MTGKVDAAWYRLGLVWRSGTGNSQWYNNWGSSGVDMVMARTRPGTTGAARAGTRHGPGSSLVQGLVLEQGHEQEHDRVTARHRKEHDRVKAWHKREHDRVTTRHRLGHGWSRHSTRPGHSTAHEPEGGSATISLLLLLFFFFFLKCSPYVLTTFPVWRSNTYL